MFSPFPSEVVEVSVSKTFDVAAVVISTGAMNDAIFTLYDLAEENWTYVHTTLKV